MACPGRELSPAAKSDRIRLDQTESDSFNAIMKRRLLLSLFVAASTAAFAADAPKPEAAKGKTFVLFDGKSLDDWQSVDNGGSGAVDVADGEMLIHAGEGLSGTVYKKAKDLPLMNYELTAETMRTEGSDFFCGLTFPVGKLDTCLTLIMGGWGGAVTGISSIDGLDASENNTSSYQRFKDNQWYKVKLRVTPKEIRVWIDDKEVVNTDIEGKKLGLRPGPIESYAPLSFTTYQTSAAFKNVKVQSLTESK
ncbi:MAG: hypothetical protein JWO89_2934 [Verrucomicrobiaceae bacterium]|nr:hypothetical protein [Verrucomicrobiaceae bacterium]